MDEFKPVKFQAEARYYAILAKAAEYRIQPLKSNRPAYAIYDRDKYKRLRTDKEEHPIALCESAHLAVWLVNCLNALEDRNPGHKWVQRMEKE